ncbi:unnamed protein product [Peronospora effusa]|nr:unnamed protein product [Peronospora effusa]
MVRVPGSSKDAGFHREFLEDKDVHVKKENKTEEPLEDRSPVTQEETNKGSKDRPDLGRGPVNMVEVELIEDKPKYPPYVLVEDTLGHDAYHDPEDHQPTVKTERLRSPNKQQTKIAQSKPTKFRMKAPGNTKSIGREKSGLALWSDADVTKAYHNLKLKAFLESDPVAKSLEIQLLGQLTGPVSTLSQLQTVTDAITALFTLLRDSNKVAGRIDPDNLLFLGFDRIPTTLAKIYKRMSILVGTTPAKVHLPLTTNTRSRSRDSQMKLQDIAVYPQMYEAAVHLGAKQCPLHLLPSSDQS